MSALPSNIVRSGEPSRTARRAASFRAVHQLLDEPLLPTDPIALPLPGPHAEAALRGDPFALNDPISRGLQAALVVRSRFAGHELARCACAGVRQYVLLGAGLDTFAFRGPYNELPLWGFELEHAGTQRWKQQLFSEARIRVPPSLTFLPVDFESGDLGETLAPAGFRSDQPACVSWMGITSYLTVDAALMTLRTLARLAAGNCVCFDYCVPAAMLGPVDRVIDEVIGRRAATAAEPWPSTFDPTHLQRQLLGLGFSSAVSVTPDDLNARYFARCRDGLRVGGSLRIICARVGRASCVEPVCAESEVAAPSDAAPMKAASPSWIHS